MWLAVMEGRMQRVRPKALRLPSPRPPYVRCTADSRAACMHADTAAVIVAGNVGCAQMNGEPYAPQHRLVLEGVWLLLSIALESAVILLH